MTDKEKQIELVRILRKKITAWHTAEDIADLLLANGVTFKKWIPVTERLPDTWKAVIVCRDFEFPDCISIEWRTLTKEWSNDNAHNPKVTHWMPLPETPNE